MSIIFMGTRASIGKLLPDGRVKYITLSYDGYFSHAGHILKTFYSTEKRVDALLELGDLQSIMPSPYGKFSGDIHTDRIHCRAYIRDFNLPAKERKAQTEKSEEEFLRCGLSYLYKDGCWYFSDEGRKPMNISDISFSCYEEEYTPYSNLPNNIKICFVSPAGKIHPVKNDKDSWEELQGLADECRTPLYVFSSKDKLIKTIHPQKHLTDNNHE